jgi:hypothetical protein
VKQEWNRRFGVFLRNPDFRRFSGTVGIGVCLVDYKEHFEALKERIFYGDGSD